MKEAIINIIGENCSNFSCNCDRKREAFIELTEQDTFINDNVDQLYPVHLVAKDEVFQLHIFNKNSVKSNLVKIDSCLINNNSKKCDLIIYSESEFYFVEMKNPKRKGKSQARKDAYRQLESTINLFTELDFKNREKFAVIAFAKPRMILTNSNSNSEKALFKDKYGTILKEGQQIELK